MNEASLLSTRARLALASCLTIAALAAPARAERLHAGDRVKLRTSTPLLQSASTDATVVTTLSPSDTYTVVETNPQWVEVRDPNGDTGWVAMSAVADAGVSP